MMTTWMTSPSPLRPAEALWRRGSVWQILPIRTAMEAHWTRQGWKLVAFSVDGQSWNHESRHDEATLRLVIAALRGDAACPT